MKPLSIDFSHVKERFLRYVQIDTRSTPGTDQCPSSAGQWDLLKVLAQELEQMGAEEVELNDQGILMATIPASTDAPTDAPVIGLLAHVDTAPVISGKGVKPRCISAYNGEAIPMAQGLPLSPENFPELKHYLGQEIICASGDTLLGADDKAGVAAIMELSAWLLFAPGVRHGKIRVAFTPDEEIGTGVSHLDVEAFGADFGVTVDGADLGSVNFSNFNAANVTVEIQGKDIHPGSAKGRMVNALLLGIEIQNQLPPKETPAETAGEEGFFHLEAFTGTTAKARMQYLIRDFDRGAFEERKEFLRQACEKINAAYGEGTVHLEIHDVYYNMGDKISHDIRNRILLAYEKAGVVPREEGIRGGTDGAQLSYRGLPCPNICTGGHNFHSAYEFIPVESLEKVVHILKNLVVL